MSELPREARELLALACDAHDPPEDGARERVRRRVLGATAFGMSTLLVSKAAGSFAGSAVTGASTKAGILASIGTKLLLAGGALVVVSAATLAAPRFMPRSEPAPSATQRLARPERAGADLTHVVPVAAPNVVTAPGADTPPPAEADAPLALSTQQPSERRAVRAFAPRRRGHKPPRGLLAAEMKLLQRASDAIAAHELARARRLLGQHRAVYPRGQLRAEREGLLTLTLCMHGGAGARRRARAFLRAQPNTVLAARIHSACKLGGVP